MSNPLDIEENSNRPSSLADRSGGPAYQSFHGETDSDSYLPRPRKKVLPAILFLLTCISTFWVGIALWSPTSPIEGAFTNGSFMGVRQLVLQNWGIGLTYMLAVILIIFLHEMGHFIATLFYRVPASYPFFIPFPINPIGTMGAVIAMQGFVADRKQIFDIGIAGPLAGLVAAVPIAYFGTQQLDLTTQPLGGIGFRLPMLMDWFAVATDVPGYKTGDVVWMSQTQSVVRCGMGRHVDYWFEHDACRTTRRWSCDLHVVWPEC